MRAPYVCGQRMQIEAFDYGNALGFGWRRCGKRFGLRVLGRLNWRTVKRRARLMTELKRRARDGWDD